MSGRRVLFGAAYYYEYQPPSEWGSRSLDEDFRLMAQAGFSVIRVGESVWSTWEPHDGEFNLDWLLPVLDAAHGAGIGVVIGTPTYAVPMWLARSHPHINAERRTGVPMGWGARQEIDFTHPDFLFYAERVIRSVVGRYAEHPAVMGFQVDNEPGNEILCNEQVFQRFVGALRERYGTVDRLNDEWGLTYWSHRLTAWDELWRPEGNMQPQYALAWRRFQARLTSEFIGWQADLVRSLTQSRPDLFVTTCLSYERPAVADDILSRTLDVTSGNPYFRMQDGLALPDGGVFSQHWTTSGLWAVYATADRMYGSRQAPFLVTETGAQAIGAAWSNEPGYDGQWRQTAWALISRGAAMIEYWHWHSLPTGAETYWCGVLPHSGDPGRVYDELARLGAEFEAAGDRVVDLTPHADLTILFSNDSKWAQEEQPFLAMPGTASVGPGVPDRRSYQTTYECFARGAFDAGLAVRTVHPGQIFDRAPEVAAAQFGVLVVPAFTIASDRELQWLERYAACGGHLVLGPRTGYEDEEARARPQRKPAFLDRAAGVWYDEFANLDAPIPLDGEGIIGLPSGGHATRWVEGLRVDNAEVLLRYRHPHFGRFAAATTKRHGSGRVTTIGTLPDLSTTEALMAWLARIDRPVGDLWVRQSPSQTVTAATNGSGESLRFVHNWSWEPSDFILPGDVTDAVTGQTTPSGDIVRLSPWDVRVFVLVEGVSAG